jgi:hypothetical protein
VDNPQVNLRLDPATRAPFTDESSVGVDRELGRSLKMAIGYARKESHNTIGWSDIAGHDMRHFRVYTPPDLGLATRRPGEFESRILSPGVFADPSMAVSDTLASRPVTAVVMNLMFGVSVSHFTGKTAASSARVGHTPAAPDRSRTRRGPVPSR